MVVTTELEIAEKAATSQKEAELETAEKAATSQEEAAAEGAAAETALALTEQVTVQARRFPKV